MTIKQFIVTVTLISVFWLAFGALGSSGGRAVVISPEPLTPLTQDGKSFDQQQKLQELAKRIAGQENKPAEEVFKNIQLLKGMPAGRLLRVMELGYGRSLGVDCTHCHVVD